MRKICLIIVLISTFLLSGCGTKKEENKELMDELNSEGYYHYTNKDLGFGLSLPKEFEYYQVQRKDTENYIDIEYFVPTADTAYYQEIQSYAKPMIVRIWNEKYWNSVSDDEDKKVYIVKKIKSKKVFTVKFWETVPKDWDLKWSENMKQSIIDMLEIY